MSRVPMLFTLKRRHLSFLTFGVLLPAALYLAFHSVFVQQRPPIYREARALPDSGQTSELVSVFISASFCGANKTVGFREAVRELNDILEVRALAENIAFRSIGISIDWDPHLGVQYLGRFGPFDEIIAGNNWLNLGTLRYIWNDFPGMGAIPQILILRRTVHNSQAALTVSNERVISRLVGVDQIKDWLEPAKLQPSQ